MTEENAIAERVTRLIADLLGVKPSDVDKSSTLKDLGADELDYVELIVYLEEEYNIAITEEEAENLNTVGDHVDIVCRKLLGSQKK